MQYNAGVHSIVDDVHYWAGTDSVTYPIGDLTRNANSAMDRITSLIQKNDNSWEWSDSNNTTLDIATKNLISGQSDYALSQTYLKILKVRIKDPNGNWITLLPVSRRKLSDSELAAVGIPSSYDVIGSSLVLNCTPNYSSDGGIEAQFQRPGEYFLVNDTTKVPGFAPQFHRLISLYTALDYTDPNDLNSRSQKIRERIIKMESDLERFYQDRDYDRPQSINISVDDYGSDMLINY